MRPKNIKFGKKNTELQGTYKIGGENRQIKKKNINEQYEKMNLNPTRKENYHSIEDSTYTYPGQEHIIKNRARSQGYNIINHEIFNKSKKDFTKNLTENAIKSTINTYNNNNNNTLNENEYANLYEEYLKNKSSEENKDEMNNTYLNNKTSTIINMNKTDENFISKVENNNSLLYKKPAYHNAPSQEANFTKENKLDKQRAYRELLGQQVK